MSVKEPWPQRGEHFKPMSVQIDSSAAKALAVNKQISAKNKHISIKFHFVKAALKSKIIILNNVKAADSTADMLTKVLNFPTTLHSTHKMHLIRG